MRSTVAAPQPPIPGATRPRAGWLGAAAVALSLLGFALFVCLATGFSFIDRLPNTLDQYLPTRPGQTSLYRIQYADGSQGFATANVVRPSSDSIAYARVYASGQAIQLHTSYTNWQGTGAEHVIDDFFARDGQQLAQVAEREAGATTLFQPAISVWTPRLAAATASTPISGETTFNGLTLTYRYWRAPNETVSLPDGSSRSALRAEYELLNGAKLISHSSSWYVANVGLARYVLTDAQGRTLQRLDLLASTRLARPVASSLPLADLLAGAPATAAFFREDAARTGAHPDVALDPAGLRVTYRLQTGVTFIASPAFANGLFYAADQNGQLAALDAYQAEPRWRFSAGGPIVAAPAMANGIVYVPAGDKTLYALDAQRGMYLWSAPFPDNLAASPVVADGILYVGAEDRTLYALDALTGQPRWRFSAGDRLVGSPALFSGRVIFGSDDALVYSLDAATGKLLWRAALDGPVEATPLVDSAGVVYAASNGSQLTALDGATGAQLWNTITRFGYLASPALGDGLIFDGDNGGAFHAFDSHTGAIVWEARAADPQPFVSSPLVLGRQVLAADTAGRLFVWEAASGHLQQVIDLGSAVTGSPTWTGDAVLLNNSQGELLALQGSAAARGLALSPLWQHAFSDASSANIFAGSLYAQPLLAGDRIVAVLQGGSLWSLEAATGAAVHLADLGDNVLGNLAQAGDVIYAGTQHGQVAAYRLPEGQPVWSTALEGVIRFGPAASDQQVFVNTLTLTASTFTALDATSGAVQWRQSFTGGAARPVLDNGRLIVAAGAILALDPNSGAILWQSNPFTVSGSLAVYNGLVYAGSSSGQGVSFEAIDASTGQPVWQARDPVRFLYSRPAYDPASGLILAGASDGQLLAYDARTGQRHWSFAADSPLESDPQVQDGVVFITSQNGTLYAVDIRSGRLLTSFLPGTDVTTSAPPLAAPGLVFTAHGSTLYALAARAP